MTGKPELPAANAGGQALPDTAASPGADPWAELRRHTPARIALGRSGTSLPTHEWLRFAAAHAMARDAVQVPLDAAALAAALQADGWATLHAHSRAPDRDTYLRRPDLGRRLDADSAARLQAAGAAAGPVGLCIVAADGLSATAVQRHVPALLRALRAALERHDEGWTLAPVVIARQARVALADEAGEGLQAGLALILLGERPGLSSPDSVGAYLTHRPRPGCSDAMRNCISNIRPQGLPLDTAARRLAWLLHEARRRRVSGIALKDDSGTALLAP